MSTFFCSDLARSENDQLFGTVKQIRLFIALEYWPSWNSKAVQSDLLPVEVRQFLSGIKQQFPQSRILLIRQRESKDRKPSCFIAIPDGPNSVVYRQQLDCYEDVLSLPFLELAAGKAALPRLDAPMFLVCNHGKHDKCCAKYGGPVLTGNSSEHLWESSHLGGCRFAANMLCLPSGLVFGRVTPEDGARVIREHEAGLLDLSNFRGRANYSKPAQAAEYFVRREFAIRGIDQLTLRTQTQQNETSWTTVFENESTLYEVEHTVSKSATPRIVACADTEPEFVWSNHLTAIRTTLRST